MTSTEQTTEQTNAQPEPANKPRKTLSDHLKALGGAAMIVGGTLLLIELLLRIVDPWGMSYFDDQIGRAHV